jgi:outer membrane protein OmpA-like peptidoglycan-associated protein
VVGPGRRPRSACKPVGFVALRFQPRSEQVCIVQHQLRVQPAANGSRRSRTGTDGRSTGTGTGTSRRSAGTGTAFRKLFGFDSATLQMPQPKLDEIAAALQADTSITDVDVTGYTDRLGSPKYNQKLSERRANAVREYLVSKGVDGSRLKAYGKGESNPVVTDCKQKKRADLIACLAPNRRVEVEQITVERRVQ